MTLERNIERIADALEAIVKAAGAKAGMEALPQNASEPQAAFQMDQYAGGRTLAQLPPQGDWQPQVPSAVPGSGQQPRVPSALPQGGRVPVSMPTGSGMQWQGSGSNTTLPANPPHQQSGNSGRVPTTASAKQYTFDQLAVATANLASSGRDVFTVLGKFGVNMLMDLPPEKYGEYAAALREAGAVI